jgi:hypothetical protein
MYGSGWVLLIDSVDAFGELKEFDKITSKNLIKF